MNKTKRIVCLFAIISLIISLQAKGQTQQQKASGLNNVALKDFLLQKNYVQIPLDKNSIGHFTVKVKVNNDSALFILDTGASGTCIDFESAKKFGITLKDISGGAYGYGGDSEKIQIGDATITMNNFRKTMAITAIDLTSVNNAYSTENSGHIDGVIGADILNGNSAIIDYETSNLYLKK